MTAGRSNVYRVMYQSDGSGFSCLGRKTSNLWPRCFQATSRSAFIALTTFFFLLSYKVPHKLTILLTLNMVRYVIAATRTMVIIKALSENLSLMLQSDCRLVNCDDPCRCKGVLTVQKDKGRKKIFTKVRS